ncbi:MAG: hypothetical protein M3Z33_02605 [Actinomycetota bacterium]|nr:hypothetical protein [Actinomycetota bacterium]
MPFFVICMRFSVGWVVERLGADWLFVAEFRGRADSDSRWVLEPLRQPTNGTFPKIAQTV